MRVCEPSFSAVSLFSQAQSKILFPVLLKPRLSQEECQPLKSPSMTHGPDICVEIFTGAPKVSSAL